MSTLETLMVSPLLSPCSSLLKIWSTCVLSTTSHPFSCWSPFTSCSAMVLENYSLLNHNSRAPWMVYKSLHSTAPMKHGTLCLDKLPRLMKNARLTQLASTCPFLKTSKKFSYPLTPRKRDGTLCMSSGMTWLSVVWKGSSTLMWMERNGFRPMLEPLGPFWKCLKKRVVFLKLSKPKETESPTSKSIWTRKPLRQKENTPLENSSSIYKFTNQPLTSSVAKPILANIWK